MLLFLFDAIDDAVNNNADETKKSHVGCDLVLVLILALRSVLVPVVVPVVFVLPSTPSSKDIGWTHRVPPAGLPIEQVLGEYALS